MFTIKEYGIDDTVCGETVKSAAERLGAKVTDTDRIFALDDGGIKAIGALSLCCGKVIIKGVFGDLDFAYRDLMNRALLNVCALMNDITVRVDEIDSYWNIFGFREKDGGMEILNRDIVFGSKH